MLIPSKAYTDTRVWQVQDIIMHTQELLSCYAAVSAAYYSSFAPPFESFVSSANVHAHDNIASTSQFSHMYLSLLQFVQHFRFNSLVYNMNIYKAVYTKNKQLKFHFIDLFYIYFKYNRLYSAMTLDFQIHKAIWFQIINMAFENVCWKLYKCEDTYHQYFNLISFKSVCKTFFWTLKWKFVHLQKSQQILVNNVMIVICIMNNVIIVICMRAYFVNFFKDFIDIKPILLYWNILTTKLEKNRTTTCPVASIK